MTAVLIRDVLIVTHDEVPFHGWITVENDQIAAIGRGHRDAQAGQSVIEGAWRGLAARLRQHPRPLAFEPHPRQRRGPSARRLDPGDRA